MPSRIIKDSIRTSYEVNSLSSESEITFYRLITFADDYGRFIADPRIMQSSLYPLKIGIDNETFKTWVDELVSIGIIKLYVSSGKPFGYFVNWEKHQSVRNQKSKYPDPNGQTYTSINDMLHTIEFNCMQSTANVTVIQSNPIRIQSESNSRLSEKISDVELGEALEIADHLYKSIVKWDPDHKYAKSKPSLNTWAKDIEKAIRIDQRDPGALMKMIDYLFTSKTQTAIFWAPNIQSGKKIRDKYDIVKTKATNEQNSGKNGTNQKQQFDAAQHERNLRQALSDS